MYYKLLSENKIVDAVEGLEFVRFQKRNGIFISCKEEYAQAVISSGGQRIWLLSELDDERFADFQVVDYSSIWRSGRLWIRKVLSRRSNHRNIRKMMEL